MHIYIKMGRPPLIEPPNNPDTHIPDELRVFSNTHRRPFNFPDPRDLPRVGHKRSPRKSTPIKYGGSRRRSYRKSRKVRKSKVRVRLSKYRKHRHSRRSRRH